MKNYIALVFVAALAVTSNAQTMVSRDTTMNYNYLHGFGANGVDDAVSFDDTTLVNSFNHNVTWQSQNDGSWAGEPWTAGVWGDLNQSFEITPSGGGFSQIDAAADSHLSAFQTHVGGALNYSTNPGNQLILNFNISSATDYTLTGNVTIAESEAGAGTLVALQRWDGIVWQQVHTTLFLSGMQGDFNYAGTLMAGEYRMVSAISITAFGNQDLAGSYNYQFNAVPEPGSMALVSAGVLFWARKRKKKD